MDKTDVDRWLDAYIKAWKSYDRQQIAALFSHDIVYRYHPYDEPIQGRDEVVRSWVGESDHDGASTRDTEGTYDATYQTIAVDGDVAVATGTTVYLTDPGGPVERAYDNCFVMRFEPDGRCREFTEWFLLRPSTAPRSP